MRRLFVLFAITWLAAVPALAQSEDEESAPTGGFMLRGEAADDVFAAGESVDIDATVAGDVFAAGGWLDVRGTVADLLVAAGGTLKTDALIGRDLLAAAGSHRIRGEIGDNLVLAGGTTTIEGRVRGKAMIASGILELERDAVIEEDVWLAGGFVRVVGDIGGRLRMAAADATIAGTIGGDVEANANALKLSPTARIEGNLVHRGPEPPTIAEGAVVTGEVTHIPRLSVTAVTERFQRLSFAASVLPLIYLFLIGTVLSFLTPSLTGRVGREVRRRPLASLGLGVLFIFAVPALLFFLVVLVIGIPFALVGVALYLAALFVGIPFCGLAAADNLARRHTAGAPPGRLLLLGYLAAFLVALWVIGLLPVAGGIAWTAALAIGVGATAMALRQGAEAMVEAVA